MKAEERHRLQQNDLRLWAGRAAEHGARYGIYVAIGIVVVVLIVAVATFLSRRWETQAAAGWEALRAATNAEQYGNVADDYQGTTVAAWARLKEGKELLRTGIELSFTDREAAHQDLTQARESFEEALQNEQAPEPVIEQALFGLAQTMEALAGVKDPDKPDAGPAVPVSEALQAWQQLLDRFPDTIYQPIAEERIKSLKQPEAREFYAWFASQTPKPEDRLMPRDLIHQGLTPPSFPMPPQSTLDVPDFGAGTPPASPQVPEAGTTPTIPPPDSPTPPLADPRRIPDDEPVEAPALPR